MNDMNDMNDTNATNHVEEINFDWSTLDDLESNLQKLRVLHNLTGIMFETHCNPLDELATKLEVTDIARINAHELAKGYRDLVILTLEPADSEDVLDHAEPGGLPPTIKFLGEQLEEASGTRNWKNTCIIDIRSFRSHRLRHLETSDSLRAERDGMSYDTTEEMIEILQPDVLLVCQSATASVPHKFAQLKSSSIRKCGRIFLHKLRNGKSIIVVGSFHPMYALKHAVELSPEISQLRQAMIKFNILQVINLLVGRVITGPGKSKLRNAVWGASHTPPRLLRSGRLNPRLDDQFKGVFLSSEASPEMKRIWSIAVKEQTDKTQATNNQFESIVRRIKSNLNVMAGDTVFEKLEELREALPSLDRGIEHVGS